MEVRILHKFHDKADYNKVYLVGETVTFDDTRAEYLIGLGLAERIVETEPEVVTEDEVAEEAPVLAEPEEEAVKPAGIQPIKTTTRRRVVKDN